MRISDWSSDVCSSDLCAAPEARLSQPLPQRLAHTHISARGGSFSPHAKLSPRHLLPGANALAVPTMLAEGAGIVGLQSRTAAIDRKSAVWGQRVSGRVDPGGRRIIKKKKKIKN